MIPLRMQLPMEQTEPIAAFRRRPARGNGAIPCAVAPLPVRNVNLRSWLLLSLFLTLLWQPAFPQVLHHREISVLGDSTQLLVVTTPAWTAQTGVLQRYERSGPNMAWREVGHAVGVVVGKNGLGWEQERPKQNTEDAALQDTNVFPTPDPGIARTANDPVKKEGDMRSPAGVFNVGPAFGSAAEPPPGWRMPYWSLNSTTECVNDPQSKFYNHVLSRMAVPPDWKSAEQMLGVGAFQWGLIIQQNTAPIRPGDGACIFLDVWSGPGKPTTGCTATAKEQIKILLAWLDPNRQPLLVQLPAAEYEALEKAWGLPPLGRGAIWSKRP